MNPQTQPQQPGQQLAQQPSMSKKLTLHKETIRELTERDLQNVASGTSSTLTIILISIREHVCL